MAMALSDDEVVDVFPRDLPTGCAEASRQRPPSKSGTKRLKVAQGAASTPPLGSVLPLCGRGGPLLACKERSLPGAYRVQVKGDLRVSLDAAFEGELEFRSSPKLGATA
eukprot:5958218-Amphidinium_carterae.1